MIMRGVAISLLMTVITPAMTATQGPKPASFEVASVRPNKSGDRGGSLRRQPGGRVDAVNMPLNTLISFAYQVPLFLLAAGPGWIADERFDVVAKLERDAADADASGSIDSLRIAMQTLLADRFKLRVRRETRESDIYALVLARPGVNLNTSLTPSVQDCSPAGIQERRTTTAASTNTVQPVFCGMQMASGKISVGGLALSQFANGLSGLVGRVVIDRTGLNGNWDFELTFAPEPTSGPLPPPGEPPTTDPNASIFTALQEQLGLKLQSAKGPVEVLVIDGIEGLRPD
jgi:uncharacterized protein (TIGR03435 family)